MPLRLRDGDLCEPQPASVKFEVKEIPGYAAEVDVGSGSVGKGAAARCWREEYMYVYVQASSKYLH